MCGIVGIIGREPVAGHLVEALNHSEYLFYDRVGWRYYATPNHYSSMIATSVR